MKMTLTIFPDFENIKSLLIETLPEQQIPLKKAIVQVPINGLCPKNFLKDDNGDCQLAEWKWNPICEM